MARIGFIGTGEIAAAMVRGLAGKGHSILVSERTAAVARQLAKEFDEVTVAGNQQVLDNSDIVCLCLLKSVAEKLLPDLTFRADHALISVMADAPLAKVRDWCAPARDICITIPLPFVATGGCPLPVYPASPVLEELFGADNLVLPQPSEDALTAHFAACATASVVMTELRAASEWLAGFTGNPAAAEAYLIKAFSGFFAGMTPGEPDQFTQVLQGLSTEGGLNATLRAKVEQGGVNDLIREGLDEFRGRLGLPPVE